MLANELIDRIERLGLLDQDIIEALREQLVSGGTRITPEAVAKLLVDNGQLTRFQATKLIGELRSGEHDQAEEESLEAVGIADDAIELFDEPEVVTDVIPVSNEVDDVFAEPVAAEVPASDAFVDAGGDMEGTPPESRPQARIKKPDKSKSVWDSFKIYGFLGIIALLLLAGVGLFWVLSRGNEDDLIQIANKLYDQQNYTNAQERYVDFLELFPNGQYASLARTRIAITQLYRAETMSDPTRALDLAKELLPKIENEKGLNEERGNLAALLVDIASNIVGAASDAKETTEKKRLLGKLDDQLELTENPNYVATSMRAALAGPMNAVMEARQRVDREIKRNESLDESVSAMTAALNAKKTKEAYDVRFELLRAFPELSKDQRLIDLIKKASEIQQTLVQSSTQLPKVETTNADSDPTRSIVLVTNEGKAAPGLSGETLYLRARGSVFAFDGETGGLKWRRFVGYGHDYEPLRLGNGVLLTESRTNEVQRRDSEDGKIRWRVGIGEPFFAPVSSRENLYVATETGRLVSMDSETGDTKWVQQFPQGLVVGPGIDESKGRAYVTGDHSNLYVLNSRDGSCVDSYYIGHRKGAVAVPPVPLLGHVFVVENAGVDYSLVHVLEVDEAGGKPKAAQPPFRLIGNVNVAPKIQDRRIIILTDRGQVAVYDIEPTAKKREQVTLAADQPATYDSPTATRMAIGKSEMWVSGKRIARYELQINTGRVVPDWVKNPGDVFIGEPFATRDALVHARMLRGTSGIRVTAIDPDTSDVFWKTDVGVPIASLTMIPGGKGVHAITSQGALFELDREALQSGASKPPIENPGGKGVAMRFEGPLDIDGTRQLLLNAATPGQIIVYDPSRKTEKLRLITLALPGGKPSGGTKIAAGGLFLPLDSGRAALMNFQTGAVAGSPFQPASDPNGKVTWSSAVSLADDPDQIVIADSRQSIYRLRVGEQLRELAQTKLEYELLGTASGVNSTFVATTSGPAADILVGFEMADLKETFKTLLEGRVTWGPVSIGNVCLVQTDDSKLRAFDDKGKEQFQVDLPAGRPIGKPLKVEEKVVVCGRDGWIISIDPDRGTLLGTVDIGQPISETPLSVGPKLLVPGSEGVIYLVEVPGNG